MKQDIFCWLTSDEIIVIERNQVQLLLTPWLIIVRKEELDQIILQISAVAYSSVILHSPFTANRTILLLLIDLTKIMGDASGWLRQGFCELELLDNITSLSLETCQNFVRDKSWRLCRRNAISRHKLLRQETNRNCPLKRHFLKPKLKYFFSFFPMAFSRENSRNHRFSPPLSLSKIWRNCRIWDNFLLQEIFKATEIGKQFLM